jgi:hypothetical protein
VAWRLLLLVTPLLLLLSLLLLLLLPLSLLLLSLLLLLPPLSLLSLLLLLLQMHVHLAEMYGDLEKAIEDGYTTQNGKTVYITCAGSGVDKRRVEKCTKPSTSGSANNDIRVSCHYTPPHHNAFAA